MKKSEYMREFIKIQKEKKIKATITMDYICYLEEQLRLVKLGDIELK